MEGKRRRKHVIIYKDARELFIRSEIEDRYVWLLKLLQKDHYEKVYKTDFVDTKDFDDDKINFIVNVFPGYKDSIAKQWYRASGMKIEEDGHCQLCGKEHTKYMYDIKNRYNGNIMRVGSSCIDNFRGINTNLPKGMSMEQFTNQQKREIDKLARLEEFSRKFGNVSDLMKEWSSEYENIPLEVSYDINLRITKIHTRAKEIYNNYLKKSLSKNAFEEFNELILLRKKVMKEISDTLTKNDNNKFACPKRVGKWLIKNGKDTVLNRIRRNGGIVAIDAISEIYEEKFVSGFVDDFNRMLERTRFSIRIFNNRIFASFIDNREGLNLNFYSNINEIMRRFGCLLFQESSQIKEEDFLDSLSLTDDHTNYSLIDQLNGLIRKSNYFVKLINEDYYLVKIDSKEYACQLSIMKFIDIHKGKILLNGSKSISDIVSALDQVSSWESIKNIEKYDIGDISAKPNYK